MTESRSRLARVLDRVEVLGNKLPDPAVLFLALLIAVWLCSALLSQFSYAQIDPRTGSPVEIHNLATPDQLAAFLSDMVGTFVGFHPLGVVLLAMLGIGVADHAGFIRTGLKALLNITPAAAVTPMLLLIAIISHSAVDAGYVLVIPLGAVIFQAAGRHPLAGIAAAFAGVSGGFSANFLPSALDPLLQGITQAGAQLIDPDIRLNPLNNWFFTSASTLLIVGLGWFLTDRVIEPRLSATPLDGDLADALEPSAGEREGSAPLNKESAGERGELAPRNRESAGGHGELASRSKKSAGGHEGLAPLNKESAGERGELAPQSKESAGGHEELAPRSKESAGGHEELAPRNKELAPLSPQERRGLTAALAVMGLSLIALALSVLPEGSAWREADGRLAAGTAPLMRSIVPLIFLVFLLPGIVFGYVAGTVRSHRDIIAGMTKSMSGLGYYLVMAFFASLFIAEFGRSNLGVLMALEGAALLRAAALPAFVTVLGVVLITGIVNLFVGSASAKWALLAPVLVPMLMQLGISPDLTQAAYRVGDSSTNIITPLMPYFPLVVLFCRRYVKDSGIGTLAAMMLPYSLVFLVAWTAFLLAYWGLGLPLGLGAG